MKRMRMLAWETAMFVSQNWVVVAAVAVVALVLADPEGGSGITPIRRWNC